MRIRLLLPIVALLFSAPAAFGKVEVALELDREAVARGGEGGIEVLLTIERGWHINANKPNEKFLIPTQVTIVAPPGVSIDDPLYPPPDARTFAFAQGKELLVYEGKVGITTGLKVAREFEGGEVKLDAALRYQACNDTTCLPPATVKAELTVKVADDAPPVAGTSGGLSGFGPNIGEWIETRGLPMTLAIVFLLGLGLNLTPCVYPLISVTIAYFGSQSHHRTSRTVGLAIVYVLGVTLSFALLGVAAAMSGGIFGAALQKPIVVVTIAAVLAALALSSFGVYQMQAPAWLMQRVGSAAPGALGSFLMGTTMGIVAAPCVGPVVIGMLVFVGSQQDPALGMTLFFALGLGMGVPYIGLALAAGAIKRLPRSGEWMLWVERLFGFILLGMALYFVKPLLPLAVQSWLLPTLIAFAGLYLGFVDPSGRNLPRFRTMQWSSGTLALFIAGWFALPQAAQSAIQWQPFDPAVVRVGSPSGRPMVVDFVADWCIPCHEMDATTFRDDDVVREARRFHMYRADLTRESDANSALVGEFDVDGVPTVIYFDSVGNEVSRLVGYVGADEMLRAMRAIN